MSSHDGDGEPWDRSLEILFALSPVLYICDYFLPQRLFIGEDERSFYDSSAADSTAMAETSNANGSFGSRGCEEKFF
jgi:hypothetical protein